MRASKRAKSTSVKTVVVIALIGAIMVFFDNFVRWLPRGGGLVCGSAIILCIFGGTILVIISHLAGIRSGRCNIKILLLFLLVCAPVSALGVAAICLEWMDYFGKL